MPTVTQSNNSSNSVTTPILEMDEFLPIVELKNMSEYNVEGEKFTCAYDRFEEKEMAKFPVYEDTSNSEIEIYQLRTRQKTLTFSLTVKKGSENSYDDDGYLIAEVSKKSDSTETVEGFEVKIKNKSDTEYCPDIFTYYESEIEIEIDISATEHETFYVRFIANDDDEDFKDEAYENVFCGCVKVAYEHTTAVGLRLTSNIEALPSVPSDYVKPDTWSFPKESFAVANTYQNPEGMCFAISMARVRKAYQDEFGIETISLKLGAQDYLYSGTIIKTIPDLYFGYGVGGALTANGNAKLIDEASIWDGALEEGAMLQYWWNYNNVDLSTLKLAIKDEIDKIENSNFDGGHSVIFKAYTRNEFGHITGFKYYDYSGIYKTANMGDQRLFLGANLIDVN